MDHPQGAQRDAAPEARARQAIDAALTAAGWIVQDCAAVNLHAGHGIAVRETPTATGPADYLLFLDGRASGVLGSSRKTASPRAAWFTLEARHR
jgi:type I restriction enzyme R subunit